MSPRDRTGFDLKPTRVCRRCHSRTPAEGPCGTCGFESVSTLSMLSKRPSSMREEAFYGVAGRIVRTIDPHTEADPAAILLQLLVGFGNAVGRHACFRVEDDEHYPNLYVCLVGETSKGRKGVSLRRALRPLALASHDWHAHCVTNGGLQSGEGLIHHVRDPRWRKAKSKSERAEADDDGRVLDDEGVEDKRKLVVEAEFASPLRRMRREGNSLTTVIREAWDTGRLTNLTKGSPDEATEAHISIVAHTTRDELQRELTEVDVANGFANRFLFASVERSKLLPTGGNLKDRDLKRHAATLRKALRRAQTHWGPLKRDADGEELWNKIYPALSEGGRGMLGAVTGRAEAQVLRLSLIYALLGGARVIKLPHLKAALAVWDYCEQSAAYLFGTATGDPTADRILEALKANPAGLGRADIRQLFSQHKTQPQIEHALDLLHDAGLATWRKEKTSGRPKERWTALLHTKHGKRGKGGGS